ncbi:ADP-ribosyl cyclase/cyclic ADP-ribose hydrolase 1-like isoform X2 [Cyclopterus lumpus]|uniref:ADP-ribosyl cyclase/cyclic ADP-ribose hydrolase n=1 Tax=Cyclopterus lumpus TaxID=8103 RepID=A0A8C2XE99_CYCLU|nr:ADP-ribosyl cyclase/cyclic ADP-ribose hydrolase 1-like isoform X2 [Cyclopterus lumpus]
MERGVTPTPRKRRGRRCLVLGVLGVLLLVVIVAVVLGLTLTRKAHALKTTFIERCEEFKGYDCEQVWGAFQQAYVGLDPCKIPHEAYDPLIAAAPLKPACNRMMFWSKTKEVVHDFTEKSDCFLTVEETLLGSVLDGLTWCGKEGSDETFTTDCPGWTDCENNAVRSFWNRVSAAFADGACGDVSAMLNGSIATPFHPASVFASNEVKRFHFPRVKSLKVVLVTQKNFVTNCTNASLKDLQKELDPNITYECKEVAEAQIQACSSNPDKPCGTCW